MITKEFLENEIETLKVQREQHLAAANAAGGAIEGFKYLIQQIEEPIAKDKNALSVEDLENMTGMKYQGVSDAKEEKTEKSKS